MHEPMNTAPFVVEQPGFKENPFDVVPFREGNPRAASFERTPERPRLSERAAQPFAGGQSVEPFLQFHFRPQEAPGVLLHPFLGFYEALRSLYLSERVDLSANLCRRLVELLALQPGWNGGTAAPPRPEVLANSVGLLVFMNSALPKFREPSLAPTLDGFAQMEWHNSRRTLEFEATPNGWSIIGTEIVSGGEKVCHKAEVARVEIEKLVFTYRWFEGTELFWPNDDLWFSQSSQPGDVFAKWRGRSPLRRLTAADEYLRVIRDGDGR